LANRPIYNWMILDENHATCSDDEVIEWEAEVDSQEEADHQQVC
jgi:hypothetical protein